ncbi:MAG: pyridoxal-phosphate dependent enzyme, partial [Clostridia bacterium]|nr:pyridoxal-phosphate dependent enzyme [Clostridia bacterium]
PAVKIVGVEPTDSPLLTKGNAGSHGIQGIGANFVPAVLDRGVIDQILTVGTNDAITATREFAATQGILVGISAGAALFAATGLAGLPENKGKTIVALLPDSGERYLSTSLFSEI